MRKFSSVIGLLMLLVISACSSSSSATSVTPTTSAPHCKDGVCVKNVIVNRLDDGELSVLFVVTDQDGKVNAARPPRFTQDLLGVQAYLLASDKSEKLAFGQSLPGQEFICWVTNTASWTKGQLSAACALPPTQADMLVNVHAGDRLKVKLDEFNFEQVVEVNNKPKNSAGNASPGAIDHTGGTRILLAVANCLETASTSRDEANQIKKAGEIIWYRWSSIQVGEPLLILSEPSVQKVGDCQIQVELPPLGDAAPFIQLIQQPGRFELIDSGADYHAPGTVLRTTGTPTPTVPISPALQSAVPLKIYDVIATNADLDRDRLMLVNSGNNTSQELEFGLRGAAAQKFAKITTAHSISTKSNDPYYLCILLDSIVEACPSVHMPFIGGHFVISFGDSFKARRLESILRNGELPLDLKVVKVETIYSQTTN